MNVTNVYQSPFLLKVILQPNQVEDNNNKEATKLPTEDRNTQNVSFVLVFSQLYMAKKKVA